jgi:hypothetical protein
MIQTNGNVELAVTLNAVTIMIQSMILDCIIVRAVEQE